MDRLIDMTSWRETFMHAAHDLFLVVAGSLPQLATGVVVVLVGWVIARAAAYAVRRTLRLLGADRGHGPFNATDVLQQAGIRLEPSDVWSRILYWCILLWFLVFGLETLGVEAINAVVQSVLGYLPRVAGVILIVIIGVLLARVIGAAAATASATAGLTNADRIGFIAQVLTAGLVLVVVAEQLGVAMQVLLLPLTVGLAAAGFAAGLAFALGAQPIIRHILAGHFLRQSLPRGGFVEINGDRGVVDRVGPTDTLLRSETKNWSVPNGRLLEEIVIR